MRALAGLLLLSVTGCATVDTHTISLTRDHAVQSGSVWNSEYLVTAAHIEESLPNTVCQHRDTDVMVLMNHRSTPHATSQDWRNPVPGEPIRYVGRQFQDMGMYVLNREHQIRGEAMGFRTVNWLGGEQQFYAGTGIVKKGMSGGTVFSEVDGMKLGIITGIAMTNGEPQHSLFVPTQVILDVIEECTVL